MAAAVQVQDLAGDEVRPAEQEEQGVARFLDRPPTAQWRQRSRPIAFAQREGRQARALRPGISLNEKLPLFEREVRCECAIGVDRELTQVGVIMTGR